MGDKRKSTLLSYFKKKVCVETPTVSNKYNNIIRYYFTKHKTTTNLEVKKKNSKMCVAREC